MCVVTVEHEFGSVLVIWNCFCMLELNELDKYVKWKVEPFVPSLYELCRAHSSLDSSLFIFYV